jgi:hypothetical protein
VIPSARRWRRAIRARGAEPRLSMPTLHAFVAAPVRRLPLALALVLAALLSLPQVWPLDRVVDHQDPLFTMWRIAWIGHTLIPDPAQLFHPNIFHPERYALTFSDSVLLQGITGSVLREIGLSPPVAYNLLIWASYPLAALTMFLLAEKVSGSAWAALVAGLAFALSPVRFDHIMHIEQSWTQWIPLQLYFALRAGEEGSVRAALGLAVSLLLQLLSGLYLFVFTCTALVVVAAGLALERRLAPFRRLAVSALIVASIVGPVAAAYVATYSTGLRNIGTRGIDEVRIYSATADNFFSAPARNLLYGWTEEFWGGPERQLFTGLVVMALTAAALIHVRRPYRATLAGVAVFAGLMCFGVNGWLYGWFYEWIPGYANLRVPSRYGNHLSAALAALAACGARDLIGPAVATAGQRFAMVGLVVLVLMEMATWPPERTRRVPVSPSEVDRVLAASPDSVVLEYPLPKPGWLPAWDADYEMRSIYHWRPLVNGYSGNYPKSYLDLLDRLEPTVPGGPEWMDAILRTGATHLVVHMRVKQPDEIGTFLFELEKHPNVSPLGDFQCWPDACRLYRLR